MYFKEVVESQEVVKYLEKRNLLKQYIKAKNYIINWFWNLADLKLRQPKEEWVYYFRINKQFRALGVSENIKLDNGENQEIIKILKVLKISNHQE